MHKTEKRTRRMTNLLLYAQLHWVEWIFGIVSVVLGALYRNISNRLKEEQAKNEAIADGIQSLLRENIVGNYNKYFDRGYCPIYAKDSIRRAYVSYHNLGGNDVATELYKKILAMPEESGEKEK